MKSITVACFLLFLLVEYIIVRDIVNQEVGLFDILAVLVIPFITFLSILKSPKCVILTDSQIIIKKRMGEKVLNIDDILEIKPYLPNRSDVRVIGSGGFLGYLGRYKNVSVGSYYSYVCDMNKAFFIATKQHKNIMISCEDRDVVIRTIKNEIFNNK